MSEVIEYPKHLHKGGGYRVVRSPKEQKDAEAEGWIDRSHADVPVSEPPRREDAADLDAKLPKKAKKEKE